MIAGNEMMPVIEEDSRLDGSLIHSPADFWCYTPDEIPDEYDHTVMNEVQTMGQFPTRAEAIAFGCGFEKDVERKL